MRGRKLIRGAYVREMRFDTIDDFYNYVTHFIRGDYKTVVFETFPDGSIFTVIYSSYNDTELYTPSDNIR